MNSERAEILLGLEGYKSAKYFGGKLPSFINLVIMTHLQSHLKILTPENLKTNLNWRRYTTFKSSSALQMTPNDTQDFNMAVCDHL